MAGEELAKLYGETKTAADTLHAKDNELVDLTKRLERLTKDTPAWGTPPRGLEWRRGRPWSRLRSSGGC